MNDRDLQRTFGVDSREKGMYVDTFMLNFLFHFHYYKDVLSLPVYYIQNARVNKQRCTVFRKCSLAIPRQTPNPNPVLIWNF